MGHTNVVGLLKTDSIAMVIPNDTISNHGTETAEEKNTRATASIEMDIVLFIPVNDQSFNGSSYDVITADYRVNGCRPGILCHHAIGIQ